MADDIDEPEDDDQTDLVPRHRIKVLEQKAKRADELEARLASVERENVFSKALGTQMSEPWAAYFTKGYEGDLTTEAIRQAAVDAGFAKVSEATPSDQSTQQQPANPNDLAAIQRMAAASAGAAPPPPVDPHQLIAEAKTKEEVMAVVRQYGEQYGVIPGDGPQ